MRVKPSAAAPAVFARSPLRYPGGKQRAAGVLAGYIPGDTAEICSPFVGGGGLELHCAGRGMRVFAYDNFLPLVEFWQTLLRRPAALADEAAKFLPRLPKARFYAMQKEQAAYNTKLRRAAAFFVINRASFSGCTLAGGMSPGHPRFTPSAVERLRSFPARQVRQLFQVSRADFACSIAAHPQALVYADPPYWLKNQNLYGRRGAEHFAHETLREVLARRGGRWLLSYNDCAEIRRLYQGRDAVIVHPPPQWRYGMPRDKTSRELLILSAELAEVLARRVA